MNLPNNHDSNDKDSLSLKKLKEKPSYEFIPNISVQTLLNYADNLKNEIDNYRPLKEKAHLWSVLQEKLISEWTYHSNAIEGSTLTLGETIFFLQNGLTVEGKPLKDFLDVRNHAEAIELLYDFVRAERNISESFIKEINALLLLGVTFTPAIDQFGNKTQKPATPGKYKVLPNTVLQQDGSIHEYLDPLKVADEMEFLVTWINSHINSLHPIIVSSIAHYNMVRIHPFDDGNGRGARILMNLIMLKKKYVPIIVKTEERRKYIQAITQVAQTDLNSFIEFIVQSSIKTQESMIEVLKK